MTSEGTLVLQNWSYFSLLFHYTYNVIVFIASQCSKYHSKSLSCGIVLVPRLIIHVVVDFSGIPFSWTCTRPLKGAQRTDQLCFEIEILVGKLLWELGVGLPGRQGWLWLMAMVVMSIIGFETQPPSMTTLALWSSPLSMPWLRRILVTLSLECRLLEESGEWLRILVETKHGNIHLVIWGVIVTGSSFQG